MSVLFCKYLHNKSLGLYEILNLILQDSNRPPKKTHEDPCTNALVPVLNSRTCNELMHMHLCTDLHEI